MPGSKADAGREKLDAGREKAGVNAGHDGSDTKPGVDAGSEANRETRHDLHELRADLLKACLELVRLDLVARTWGNLSVRTGRGTFLITPSGIPYEDLEADDMVEVSLDDLSWSGPVKPSSEKELHALAYRLRSDAEAIVHTHQFWASAVAAARVSIPAETDERSGAAAGKTTENAAQTGTAASRSRGAVPCAPYALPTTRPLAKASARTLEMNPEAASVLLANHGAVCLGASLEEAIAEASALENRARIFVLDRFAEQRGAVAGRNGASAGHVTAGTVELSSGSGSVKPTNGSVEPGSYSVDLGGTQIDGAVNKLLEAFVANRGRGTV